MRKLFKGGNYSREETIQRQKLFAEIRYLILHPFFGNLTTHTAIFFSSDLLLLYLIDGSEKKPRSNFLVVFPSGPINFVAFILFFVPCWILWFECYTGDFFQEHKMKDEIAIQIKRNEGHVH